MVFRFCPVPERESGILVYIGRCLTQPREGSVAQELLNDDIKKIKMK